MKSGEIIFISVSSDKVYILQSNSNLLSCFEIHMQ